MRENEGEKNKRRGSSSIEWEKSVGQSNHKSSRIYSLTKHVDISLIFYSYCRISIQIFRKSLTYLSMFKFFIYQLMTLNPFTWNDKYSSNSSHFFATWTNLYEGRLITWKSRKNWILSTVVLFFLSCFFFSVVVGISGNGGGQSSSGFNIHSCNFVVFLSPTLYTILLGFED